MYKQTIENLDAHEFVHAFAKKLVETIIEDAIQQSSKTTWLIHCSENCHRLNPVYIKKVNSYICWTPESNQNMRNSENSEHIENDADRIFLCNSIDKKLKTVTNDNEVYTLPLNTLQNEKSISSYYKTIVNGEEKCLKPKAIHALNVLKSSHQKTFSDFKLFLINLYSSNDVVPKNIGSEHSAFTKYCCQTSSSSEKITDKPNDRTKRKSKIQNKNENLRIMHIKTEKNAKTARKCNRIKRCTLFNIKHSFCNVFKSHKSKDRHESRDDSFLFSFKDRSLPPLPSQSLCACPCEKTEIIENNNYGDETNEYDGNTEYTYDDEYVEDGDCPMHRSKTFDFAANIEKVKDYGWYWGPMSSEAAEKLLQDERDGSFIVRDSSDDRYIFSLTFKLNNCIRHVRIEHGQGNFSFGNYTKFKSHTIVDFIENAVQHSRSGRYLFFLHRRPILGPMRVQLLYPVSRFKHVQSLQHMCRFVILKTVRRDLITSLPLPKSLIEYLSSKDYYAEQKF
ncbi:hypothetical protein PGB90_006873 [Kerria lacca]